MKLPHPEGNGYFVMMGVSVSFCAFVVYRYFDLEYGLPALAGVMDTLKIYKNRFSIIDIHITLQGT